MRQLCTAVRQDVVVKVQALRACLYFVRCHEADCSAFVPKSSTAVLQLEGHSIVLHVVRKSRCGWPRACLYQITSVEASPDFATNLE